MRIKQTSSKLKNYKMMIKSHQLFNLQRQLSSQICSLTIWVLTQTKSSSSNWMPSVLPLTRQSKRSLFLTVFLRTSVIREWQLQHNQPTTRTLRSLQWTKANNWIASHKRYNKFWPKGKKLPSFPGNPAWISHQATKLSKFKPQEQSQASLLVPKTNNQLPPKPPKNSNNSSTTFNFWSWFQQSKTQRLLELTQVLHKDKPPRPHPKHLAKDRTVKWLKAAEGQSKRHRASSKLQSRTCSIICNQKIRTWSQHLHRLHQAQVRKAANRISPAGANPLCSAQQCWPQWKNNN